MSACLLSIGRPYTVYTLVCCHMSIDHKEKNSIKCLCGLWINKALLHHAAVHIPSNSFIAHICGSKFVLCFKYITINQYTKNGSALDFFLHQNTMQCDIHLHSCGKVAVIEELVPKRMPH